MLDKILNLAERLVAAYEMNAETYKAEVLQPMRYITWDEEGYKEHVEGHVEDAKRRVLKSSNANLMTKQGGTISGI